MVNTEGTLRILLCCGAGMSSGFLASQTRKAAKKQKVAASVEARSYSEVPEFLRNIDVLMIGPHFAHELESCQRMAAPYNVPVILIPQEIYSGLDGAGLLALAQKSLE